MPCNVNVIDLGNGDGSSTSGTAPVQDLKRDKIKVVVRLRPVTGKNNKRSIVVIDDKSLLLEERGSFTDKVLTDVKRMKKFHEGNHFIFDAVFNEDATQEEVYDVTAKYLVHEVVAGYNGMIFAYGATGSGKTYTMMAMNYDMGDTINYNQCGIIIQTFKDLFSIIEGHAGRFIVTLSYMEIYNETIKDLFNSDSSYLELRGNGNVQIVGLTELVVTSSQQAINSLKKGNEIRSVRYTGANSASSRSHAVLIIVLRHTTEEDEEYAGYKPGTRQSKLLFVDLAGSERAKHTKNKGKLLQEGGHINKSLLALGNCISALSNGTKALHVNFRDSKLTRLLREPLSGNYRTIMIAQVNPAFEYREDIKNTLIFATKAMGITKRVKQNSINSGNRMPNTRYQNLIGELRDEVARLKDKIKEQSHGTRVANGNHKARKLRDEMISVFEERMKLRQQLLDIDNHILLLSSEAEKQHQIVSHWQSKSNKLYRWRNSTNPEINDKDENNNSVIREHINKATSVMNSIETEQDKLLKYRNDIIEKLEHLKEKAIDLENELHVNLDEDTEKELLKLFCRVHELEADKLSLQGERMLGTFELQRSNDLLTRYQQQQKISDDIITKQRQLIEDKKINIPVDLQTLYRLYQEEIHVTTLRYSKNGTSSNETDPSTLPILKEVEREAFSASFSRRKKTFSSSSESIDEWGTSELETLATRLPRVETGMNVKANKRSPNPSPIPPAVLFPPITF